LGGGGGGGVPVGPAGGGGGDSHPLAAEGRTGRTGAAGAAASGSEAGADADGGAIGSEAGLGADASRFATNSGDTPATNRGAWADSPPAPPPRRPACPPDRPTAPGRGCPAGTRVPSRASSSKCGRRRLPEVACTRQKWTSAGGGAIAANRGCSCEQRQGRAGGSACASTPRRSARTTLATPCGVGSTWGVRSTLRCRVDWG